MILGNWRATQLQWQWVTVIWQNLTRINGITAVLMLVAMIDDAMDLSAKVTVEWPGSHTCERNSLAQMVLDVLFAGAYTMKSCSLEKDRSMCNAHAEWQMTTNDAATERIIQGLSGAVCEKNDMDEKGLNRYPAHHCDEFYTKFVLGGADIDTTRN